MFAKLTAKNQPTLPKAVLAAFPETEYFNVTEEDGHIVLAPVRVTRTNAVRAKLAALGLTEAGVAEAVAWSRRAG